VAVRRRRPHMSPRGSLSYLQSFLVTDHLAVRADVFSLHCGDLVAAGVLFLYAVRHSTSCEVAGPQSQCGTLFLLLVLTVSG